MEVDFLNDFIVILPHDKTTITLELKERFLSSLDPFWHSDKDQLDFFQVFNTGEYFCQRKKLKYDFAENVSYWSTYSFTGATKEQAEEFKNLLQDFFVVSREVKLSQINQAIEKIDKELIFFEQRYEKKIAEKNAMLSASDWRVLPDVEDSYPGEKDMWIAWRNALRNQVIKMPSDFETNLEFFKYSFNIKYPIDPKNYFKKYPDGKLEDGSPAPAFLDQNDPNQWVGYDTEASVDFVNKRLLNIIRYAGNYKPSYIKIKSSILELMKKLQVDQISEIDWDNYYVDETEIVP
jgi:hypothetical protein